MNIKEYILTLINQRKMKSKQEAIDRLNSIEKETKELRKIIEDADKPKPITERVFNIQSAIKELGENDEDVIEYRKLLNHGFSNRLILEKEITLFAKALNEGEVMDWTKINQRKYYLWMDFSLSPTSSGFVYSVGCSCHVSDSVSSRHTYKTEELANHTKKCIQDKYYNYYK